jgi:hypothetical protein
MTFVQVIRTHRKNRQTSIGTYAAISAVSRVTEELCKAPECLLAQHREVIVAHRAATRTLAYLYLGPEMIARGEARATSLPYVDG